MLWLNSFIVFLINHSHARESPNHSSHKLLIILLIVPENFTKETKLWYHLLFSRDSKLNSWWDFSLVALLIVPIITSAALYWMDSNFRWKETLSKWDLMKDLYIVINQIQSSWSNIFKVYLACLFSC